VGWGKKVKFDEYSRADEASTYQCLNADKQERRIDDLKTVVLGANNSLYLTDGHHSFSTFHDMPNGGPEFMVTVYIDAKLPYSNLADFWRQMSEQGKAWLYKANGESLDYKDMPVTVGRASLKNDPYRAAAYFLRDGVWKKPKPAIPFVEFYWAQYMRAQKELQFPDYYAGADYVQWLERIHNHLLHINDSQIIYKGFTAKQLGWTGQADFKSLEKLLCHRKSATSELGRLGVALSQRGMPIDCSHRRHLNRTSIDLGLSAIPRAINKDGSINVLIEIPAGNTEKWQQSKTDPSQLEWEYSQGQPRQIKYLAYPANYGIVSNTLFAKDYGGDGDPLDVLVLGDALPAGSIQKVKIIALMRMLDNGEQDDKLIAVPLNGVFSELNSLEQLKQEYPGVLTQLQHWFEHYKGKTANVSIQTIEDKAAAMALINDTALIKN
jgi:inorganic pyrophosphatase